MFKKLPEFVACNLKCVLLVLQRLVKCSVNDTEIAYMVIDVLMGLKAKSSTFREFCEKFMELLRLSISNSHSESFLLLKYNLILTDKKRRMNEENISVW